MNTLGERLNLSQPVIALKGSVMLVLSRKQGERIRLGESIVLTVLACRGRQVRLGIEAPENVVILREEVRNQWRDPEPLAHKQSRTG
jgi:carbon storage regulator